MFRFFTSLLFKPDEPAGGGDPAPVEPAAAPEPAAPSPWAADLATYFGEDTEAIANADRYMREKVQPHATQLEQKLADYAPAHELFDDLREDPLGTYLAMTTELLGAETSDKIADLIAAGVDPEDAVKEVTEAEPVEQPGVDPDVERMKEKFLADERTAAYQAEMARIKALPEAEGVEIDEDQFAMFVGLAKGDFDVALTGYKEFVAKAQAKWGTPPPAPPADPAAPAALGTQAGGAPPSTPPVVEHYATMDDALDAAMADLRAARQAPTVVGTV